MMKGAGRSEGRNVHRTSGQDGMTLIGLLLLLLLAAAGVYWWMGRGKKTSAPEPSGVEKLQVAAENGDAAAACRLGRLYAEGLEVPQDWQQAATWFRKAAQEGNAEGEYQLGRLYETGNGTPRNWEHAAQWYRKAAEHGHADAQWKIGLCHRDGRGVAKDPIWAKIWLEKAAGQGQDEAKEALALLDAGTEAGQEDSAESDRVSAEGGDAAAQCRLGRRYMDGDGVEKDEAAGAAWYRKAAEQGHAEAQCRLGDCLRAGKGVEKNGEEAETWYRKAADQGLAVAQRAVGKCRMAAGDPAGGVTWFREAAGGGDPEGQYLLAVCYQKGTGTAKDPAQARRWLQAAAKNGHPKALAALKTLESSEMPQWQGRRLERMKELLGRARQGDKQAQYELGVNMLDSGREKDGLGWIQAAAQGGFAEAAAYLGRHWARKDARQSFLWWSRAADMGLAEAQWQMVELCRSGTGTTASDTEALRWARKAAEGGNRRAMELVAECYENGTGVRQDYGEAKRWYARLGYQDDVARMDQQISGKGGSSHGPSRKTKGNFRYVGNDGKIHTHVR